MWSALALLLPVFGARAEETLQAPGLEQRVKVERTQFEVIVWPPNDDVAGGVIFRFPDAVKIPNREKSVSVIVSVHGPRDALARVSASQRIKVSLPE